MVETVFI